MRQLLTESVLLSALGGIVGVALAAGGLQLLRLLPPGTIPRIEEVSLDAGVLIFSAVSYTHLDVYKRQVLLDAM